MLSANSVFTAQITANGQKITSRINAITSVAPLRPPKSRPIVFSLLCCCPMHLYSIRLSVLQWLFKLADKIRVVEAVVYVFRIVFGVDAFQIRFVVDTVLHRIHRHCIHTGCECCECCECDQFHDNLLLDAVNADCASVGAFSAERKAVDTTIAVCCMLHRRSAARWVQLGRRMISRHFKERSNSQLAKRILGAVAVLGGSGLAFLDIKHLCLLCVVCCCCAVRCL